MSRTSLESRISKLEQQVAELIKDKTTERSSLEPSSDAWKSTIGAFKGAGMKAVLDEAMRIRERHREAYYKRQARRRTTRKRQNAES